MLKQRVATAAVLIPAVLAGLLVLSSPTMAIVFGAIVMLGAYEWAGLTGWDTAYQRGGYVLLVLLLTVTTGAFLGPWVAGNFSITVMGTASVWWCAVLYWLIDYQRGGKAFPRSRWFLRGSGVFVLVSAWLALVSLHASGQQGRLAVVLLMLLVWGADIGAYFAGRRWGRAKLAPNLSPGKTWAGVWGAFAAAAVIILPLGFEFNLTPMGALCLMLPTVVFSIVGDLFESLIKRIAGVKDSGNLLPGHGGVLDRVDSLLAAAPIFASVAYTLEALW